jgi:hypothetical protein
LKIEDGHEGLVATLSQRDDSGKVVGSPSVFPVRSKEEAKRQAKTLARSLGLKVYGVVDKTAIGSVPRLSERNPAETREPGTDYTKTEEEHPPWAVPGVGKSL